LKAKGDLNFR